MDSERLALISDANWGEMRRAHTSVLTLTQRGCPRCRAFTDELTEWLSVKHRWEKVRFGRIVMDGDNVAGFKEDNASWLGFVESYPFTVVFRNGVPTASFYGGDTRRLGTTLIEVKRQG